MEPWSLETAIVTARRLQLLLYPLGYYVAIAGGIVHKDGYRSDLDLVFVPCRTNLLIAPKETVLSALYTYGVIVLENKDWLIKAVIDGGSVDIRFISEIPPK